MKLWLLRPQENQTENGGLWNPWYDKCFGMVVRSEDEMSAREMAAGLDCSDLPAFAWTNPKLSTCTELTPEGEEGVIMEDVARA